MKLERLQAGALDAQGPEARTSGSQTPAARFSASRRELVLAATVVGGSLVVGCSPADLLSFGAKTPDFGAFGPFLKIAPDGAVTVIAKHIEFGQGSQTGLAAIVAEELDADWSRVTVEAAPANTKLYANTLMGFQGTGGSTAMANSWMQMRKAGAAARAMFVQAAAAEWKAPAAEIDVKDGVVSHAGSGKSAPFAALLAAAGKIAPPAAPKLKDPAAFTLIGTERVRRLDARAKSTGAAHFTQDVHLPGMLTAVVAHPPRFGGKVEGFDATAAKKVPGVVDVFKIPTGVAVVAQNTWAAIKGREALKVTWDEDKAEKRSSAAILEAYRKIAAGGTDAKWDSFEKKGDATNAFAGDTLKFSYDYPYLAHAAMEPMNCIAAVDGNTAKLTFGCQIPSADQLNVALVVGNLPANIVIETLPAGGSFGRRATLDSDYVAECAQVAKKVGGGKPVKLVWTREDDMTGGKYRPMAHHAIEVKLGADGYPAAWRHRIVIQSFMKGSPLAPGGVDATAVEGAMGSPYLKAIPVVDGQVTHPKSPVSVSWWRSVGATHTALAMEHTIDQLAAKAGKDPVEYRRALYEKAGAQRHLAVLNLAAEKAGWGKPLEKGVARGVAVHESFNTVVANIAEVELVNGEPRVRHVVCAVDCGLAIAPDQVRAQMEGGLCYGLSSALFGAITLKDGVVEQRNFDAYRVLRINEAPVVETYILPSASPPTGAGEPGTPVIIAAVANALLALNGKATSSLPLVASQA
jgi:isoquinoline 1-oxidoreductase beta subunit